MRALKESTENNTEDNVIEITEYSYDVYYAFLKYRLYWYWKWKSYGFINFGDSLQREQCLKRECSNVERIQFIKNGITIENVCAFYYDSIEYQIRWIREYLYRVRKE